MSAQMLAAAAGQKGTGMCDTGVSKTETETIHELPRQADR